MTPEKGLANNGMSGTKQSKIRLTYHLCANVDGSEKREPFISDHAVRPRAFQKTSGEQLGFDFASNKTNWMTQALFSE